MADKGWFFVTAIIVMFLFSDSSTFLRIFKRAVVFIVVIF